MPNHVRKLAKNVIERSNPLPRTDPVPSCGTGVGNAHSYVRERVDPERAKRIAVNAKCSRPGVCNAAETLLIDEAFHAQVLPPILKSLEAAGVTIYGDEKTRALGAVSANAEDRVAAVLAVEKETILLANAAPELSSTLATA